MQYYIADCHFGHNNVLRFDNRPFKDIEEMENVMVGNWNSVVRLDDTVYILGDFCWGKADEWLRIVKKLKGNKVLIEGNHDLRNPPAELKSLFADIKPYKEVTDNGRQVILCHFPIPFYRHSSAKLYFMLCGHVHNTAENEFLEKWTKEMRETQGEFNGLPFSNRGQIYNVGCMMPWVGYTPRTLDEIIANWNAHHS